MSIKHKDIFDDDFEITYEEDDFSEILREDSNGCGEPLADPEEPPAWPCALRRRSRQLSDPQIYRAVVFPGMTKIKIRELISSIPG